MVLVTHDPGIAAEAGRCIRMADGRVVSDTLAASRAAESASLATPPRGSMTPWRTRALPRFSGKRFAASPRAVGQMGRG